VPISVSALYEHRDAALATVEGAAGFGLHEARHTYASLMIAVGVRAEALAEFMGHASIGHGRPLPAPAARRSC
jgi:integrase